MDEKKPEDIFDRTLKEVNDQLKLINTELKESTTTTTTTTTIIFIFKKYVTNTTPPANSES